MIHRIRLILLFLIIAIGRSNAEIIQDRFQPLLLTHYGFEEGLPVSPVTVILQDHIGYMWFGTDYGLFRYDGYSFQPFRHDDGLKTELSSSGIRSLFEDKDGYLWIGTRRGLNRFDPARENCTQFTLDEAIPKSIRQSSVEAIIQSPDSRMWFATQTEFACYDAEKEKWQLFPNKDFEPNTHPISICMDAKRDIWLGRMPGLFRFDLNSETYQSFYLPKYALPDVNLNHIYAIKPSTRGGLWLGTWHSGLFYLSPDNEFTSYPYTYEMDEPELNYNITSIYEDAKGILWLGTLSGGMYRFDPETGSIQHDVADPDNPYTLKSNRIHSIYKERSGAIWIASHQSLSRFDPQQNPFHFITDDPKTKAHLSANAVYSMCEGADGSIYFGTYLGGLNRYNPKTGEVKVYRCDENDPSTIAEDTITALCPDPSGNIWVGTWKSGLCLFNVTTETFKRFPYNLGESTNLSGAQLSNNIVRSLWVDKDGMVWIGTETEFLNVLDPKTEKFHIEEVSKDIPVFTYDEIYQDHTGRMWFGTGSYSEPGSGLLFFDPPEHSFQSVEPLEEKLSLWGTDSPSISEDAVGDLWIASQFGLFQYLRDSNTFKHYTPLDGFQSQDLVSVAVADDGSIWTASQNSGLSQFFPKQNKVINYDAGNGLENFVFLRGSILKARDGTIYIGSSKGVVVIPSGSIQLASGVAAPYLQRIRLNGENLPPHSIQSANPLRLDYWQNALEFNYTSFSFTKSHLNKYAYRLVGLDDRWVDAASQRTARYSSLPPGEYAFEAKTANYDGVWSQEPARFSFIISPPFWQKLSFQFSVLFALACIIVAFYKWRVYQIKQKNAWLELTVTLRTNQLKASHDHLHNIINTSPLVIIGFQPEGSVTFLNPTAIKVFGLQNDDIIGQPWWTIVSNQIDQEKLRALSDSIYKEDVNEYEQNVTLKSGMTRSIIWRFVTHFDENQNISEILAFGADVTDHVEREILETSSREQRNIGREIHDSICQTLTGINCLSERLVRQSNQFTPDQAELINRMNTHLQNVTVQSRNIARGLYMHELEHSGLRKAIEIFSQNIEHLYNIECHLVCPDELPPLSFGTASHLYRIIQEAVSNAVKYSNSESIEIKFAWNNHHLIVSVIDDGIGFDANQPVSSGMGINIMKCRARMINAALNIESKPGRGAAVVCSLVAQTDATVKGEKMI